LFASDGDLIVAQRRLDRQRGGVAMVGHVRVPGVRSLAQAQTVGALLGGKEALKEDPYLLLGVLETEDPVTSARRYFALSLENIFRGLEDFKLRDDDRLIILGRDDVAYLSSAPVQEIGIVEKARIGIANWPLRQCCHWKTEWVGVQIKGRTELQAVV
jgi:hypothetical protein